jgi:hypothetical protein
VVIFYLPGKPVRLVQGRIAEIDARIQSANGGRFLPEMEF